MAIGSDVSFLPLTQVLRETLVSYHDACAGDDAEQMLATSALEAFDQRIVPLASDPSKQKPLSGELITYYDDFLMPLAEAIAPPNSHPAEQIAAASRMSLSVDLLSHFMTLQDAVDG